MKVSFNKLISYLLGWLGNMVWFGVIDVGFIFVFYFNDNNCYYMY